MAKKSFKIKGNLAEALDDTVSSAKNNAGELHIEIIPLRKIALDPDNPRDLVLSFKDLYEGTAVDDIQLQRKQAEKDALASMAKSIKEQGVINPVVVYKHGDQYRLIAGERRTLSSIIAGKADIPAKVLTSRPNQLKLSLIQWIENIEREDLSLWERVRNLDKILAAYASDMNKNTIDITPTDLCKLLGCSIQQGVNYRHLLNASKELQHEIQQNTIKNIEKAALIANSSENLQSDLIRFCINGATLSELKKFARDVPKSNKPQKSATKITNINFGSTKKPKVAEIIIHSVLKHKDFSHLNERVGNINWQDHRSITNAFKQLLKLLEQA